MKQNSESNQLKEQIENTEVTRNNNKSQAYRDKTAEELSDLEVEVESFMNDNTEDKEANLIKGEIVDVDLDKEGGQMAFTVEFEGNRGKFTIDLIDETDSKSDKIKSIENRVGAKIENTSKFLNQPLYIVRHETGQLYGFIPKRRHKLTYAIFGDSCVSNSDKIFPGNCLANSLILAVLAAGAIIVGLASNIVLSIVSIPLLFFIGIAVGEPTGGLVYENIKYKSVYTISQT
jgi:hypothetical protein